MAAVQPSGKAMAYILGSLASAALPCLYQQLTRSSTTIREHDALGNNLKCMTTFKPRECS